jgi:hypothetical protein
MVYELARRGGMPWLFSLRGMGVERRRGRQVGWVGPEHRSHMLLKV